MYRENLSFSGGETSHTVEIYISLVFLTLSQSYKVLDRDA